jgi:hypothetical protein
MQGIFISGGGYGEKEAEQQFPTYVYLILVYRAKPAPK